MMRKNIESPIKVFQEAKIVKQILLKKYIAMKPKTFWERQKFGFKDQTEYFKLRAAIVEVMFMQNLAREYLRRMYLNGCVTFTDGDEISWEQFIVYSYQIR
ncbi:hypothetical protein PS2_032 [Serratia phage PS2]|uniref:Uncharacterized protein n=1 Tax=Serratia phage PS2 TaxID=1481112 RepID=A0A023W6C5_9CAUD|nr:hypothetical protein FF83_gp032 [Serratia phage PS2]AHY25282.1 hypothetical protein PS2_032 [Serratia phage PS2]